MSCERAVPRSLRAVFIDVECLGKHCQTELKQSLVSAQRVGRQQ